MSMSFASTAGHVAVVGTPVGSGVSVGENVGCVGNGVGCVLADGTAVGSALTVGNALAVGCSDGSADGIAVGSVLVGNALAVGSADGSADGSAVGSALTVGSTLAVGSSDGCGVGSAVGSALVVGRTDVSSVDGSGVGSTLVVGSTLAVGKGDGIVDGSGVGAHVSATSQLASQTYDVSELQSYAELPVVANAMSHVSRVVSQLSSHSLPHAPSEPSTQEPSHAASHCE